MNTLINFIHLTALVCWIGSVVFFSFFTAPAVFKTLEREKAGELIGAIFPRYYMIGYVCGVLVFATLAVKLPQLLHAKMVCLLIMATCTAYAGTVIRPRAAELKVAIKSAAEGADKESLEAEFRSVHTWSVRLNATVLFLGLTLLWFTADGLTI